MWYLRILFRLLFALGAGLVRFYIGSGAGGGTLLTRNGKEFNLATETNKGRIIKIKLGIPLKSPKMTLLIEGGSDRFFKSLGLSTEFQTGDETFDSRVYIVSDHSSVEKVLKEEFEARGVIFDILAEHYTKIRTDGRYLWIESSSLKEPRGEDFERLAKLQECFSVLESESTGLLGDRFVMRALLVEAVIWSVAGYALGSFIDFAITFDSTTFLDMTPIYKAGAGIAVAIFCGLLWLSWYLLRGSSRGHRVILESALVLLFSVPISGLQAAIDLNNGLDNSETQVTAKLARKDSYQVQSRRNRNRTVYKIWLDYEDKTLPLNREISVSGSTYHSVDKDHIVILNVGDGWLGAPWIRSIERGEKIEVEDS